MYIPKFSSYIMKSISQTTTNKQNLRIAIIGLGYVGTPLLCAFSSVFDCWGLDIDSLRIKELREGIDSRNCVPPDEFDNLKSQQLTTSWEDLQRCNVFIVAAPTPVDEKNIPDISILRDICVEIGKILKDGDIVIFESTVCPGTTEEICGVILENNSGLKEGIQFHLGFSPERINIGDRVHTLKTVPKIVSASDSESLDMISHLYQVALGCDVIKASSIKVAEAAKLYENVQRDVLIALANQYSRYCERENIDIFEVTRCASTKWNFSQVNPGLVGGHCIGVDPYYLIDRCNKLDVDCSVVREARKENECTPQRVAEKVVQKISDLKLKKSPKDVKILILGFSYKPNTGDIRNTKIPDVMCEIRKVYQSIYCYDPLVETVRAKESYGVNFIENPNTSFDFDFIVELVTHDVFKYLKKDLSLSELL